MAWFVELGKVAGLYALAISLAVMPRAAKAPYWLQGMFIAAGGYAAIAGFVLTWELEEHEAIARGNAWKRKNLAKSELAQQFVAEKRGMSAYYNPCPPQLPQAQLMREAQLLGGKSVEQAQAEVVPHKPDAKAEALVLLQSLEQFGLTAELIANPVQGSRFTRYYLRPGRGSNGKVARIDQFRMIAEDLQIAMTLPKPVLISGSGENGAIAIDVPNEQQQVLNFSDFVKPLKRTIYDPLKMVVGVNLSGNLVTLDLSDSDSPHVLGGGTTGSGKSEYLRTAVLSLLFWYAPDALELLIIDGKGNVFVDFNGAPHLITQTISKPDEAARWLETIVSTVDKRYEKFAARGVQDIAEWNLKFGDAEAMQRIVIFIDEYADLLDAATKTTLADIEKQLRRLVQRARAAGVHIVLFTQKPVAKSGKSPSGLDTVLRGNLPASIGFRVQRMEESTIVMGMEGCGCNALLGKGDCLLRIGDGVQRLQSLLIDSPDLIKWAIARFPDELRSPSVPTDFDNLQPLEQTILDSNVVEEIEEEWLLYLWQKGIRTRQEICKRIWGVARGEASWQKANERLEYLVKVNNLQLPAHWNEKGIENNWDVPPEPNVWEDEELITNDDSYEG